MINTRLDDPACCALAKHFYPTASPAQISNLARLIEDMAVHFGRIRLLPERPTLPRERDGAPTELLDRLAHRIRVAEIAYAKALAAVYPIGTRTVYIKNGNQVVCTVVGHKDGTVRVRGSSGAEYYVRGAQLVLPSNAIDQPE